MKFFPYFILFVSFICPQVQAQIEQQQVIPGELPDPSVIEVDGVYYATGSSNDWGPVYPIYRSTDLKTWTFLTYVFDEKPKWTISSYWAPELFYHNGTFYCYYTAKRTDGTSMIGVATTNNISKGFKDHGELLEWGDEAIDAFVYNEEGTLYITWKAYGLNPEKPIRILGSELSDNGLSLRGNHFNILTGDENSWEKGGIEGQCIVKKDGYLYMFYSGNACCGVFCDYQVGVARAKEIEGPWEKFEANPLLKGNDTWKCPGHGTAINTNESWYYLYHAYPSKGFPYLGRSAILSEIAWDKQSGWPYFKENTGLDSSKTLREDLFDDFSSSNLANWWRYDIPSYTFSAEMKDNKLILTNEKSSKNQSGSVLGINPAYADFTITTKVTEKNQALKGLTVYATKDNSLGVGIKGSELILWKVKDDKFIELNRLLLKKAENIFLKGQISQGHIAEFQYSIDGKKWQPIKNDRENSKKIIGNNLSWWSWGIKAGLFVKTDPGSGDNKAVFEEYRIEYPKS